MILTGTREIQLGQEKTNIICPHCGNDDTTEIFVKLKYYHVFFIPFSPLNKSGITMCKHCKLTMNQAEFPKEWVLKYYQPLKSRVKTPWWTFFILILFVVFIFVSVLQELVG